MGDKSNIEWTEATWNPIRARNKKTGGVGHFCEIVSAGCAHCYAQRQQPRFRNSIRYNKADRDKVEIFLDMKTLTQPIRWKRPRMIFPCSMTDLFGSWVTDEWLDRVFAVMALTPQHTYQILTKRPERMRDYTKNVETRMRICEEIYGLTDTPEGDMQVANMTYSGFLSNGDLDEEPDHVKTWPLPNVWLGVSCEDQKTADERIPLLLKTPAAVRWISAEPLLGPIDFRPRIFGSRDQSISWLDHGCTEERIDWVVVGGESGHNARPMHPDWPRSIREQCIAAGVKFFFKQWGEWYSGPSLNVDGPFRICRGGRVEGVDFDTMPDPFLMYGLDALTQRVGKKKAGRLFDGREWNEMPEVKI